MKTNLFRLHNEDIEEANESTLGIGKTVWTKSNECTEGNLYGKWSKLFLFSSFENVGNRFRYI